MPLDITSIVAQLHPIYAGPPHQRPSCPPLVISPSTLCRFLFLARFRIIVTFAWVLLIIQYTVPGQVGREHVPNIHRIASKQYHSKPLMVHRKANHISTAAAKWGLFWPRLCYNRAHILLCHLLTCHTSAQYCGNEPSITSCSRIRRNYFYLRCQTSN